MEELKALADIETMSYLTERTPLTQKISENNNYTTVRFLDEVPIQNGQHSASGDFSNEIGSRSSLNRDPDETNLEFDHWQMNYHEAAIFLEEGQNNEKFDSHPQHPSALPAYLLVHNSWYYGLDLATSILLLLLALVEEPAVPLFEVSNFFYFFQHNSVNI